MRKRTVKKTDTKASTPEMRLKSILHDLSSPLSVVQLNLDLLQENLQGSELNRLLDQALTGLKHANRIVISTKKAAYSGPKEEAFSAVEELDRICSESSSQFRQNQIMLEKDYQNDKMLIGDRVAFHSIIFNIMLNAVEELSARPLPRMLKLSVNRNPREFIISFRDNGRGIPERLLKHIFLPGFSTKGKDRGIGLSLVKANLKSYFSAELQILSKVGEGTVVKLRFPQLRSAGP
jgi:signal transduction histidine kinase